MHVARCIAAPRHCCASAIGPRTSGASTAGSPSGSGLHSTVLLDWTAFAHTERTVYLSVNQPTLHLRRAGDRRPAVLVPWGARVGRLHILATYRLGGAPPHHRNARMHAHTPTHKHTHTHPHTRTRIARCTLLVARCTLQVVYVHRRTPSSALNCTIATAPSARRMCTARSGGVLLSPVLRVLRCYCRRAPATTASACADDGLVWAWQVPVLL